MILQKRIKSKSYSVHQSSGARAIALITALAGSLFIGMSGRTTLTCQRSISSARLAFSQNGCTLDNSSFFSFSPVQIALSDLYEAQVKRGYEHRYYVSYQVVLITAKGEIPITDASPSQRGWKSQVASDINGFLSKPHQGELTLRLEDQQWSYIVGLLVAIAGTGLSLAASSGEQSKQANY